MPSITDWIMVGITGVYVVATIFICLANWRSAKATQEQLAEMQKEHNENIRLNIMPYFEVNCNEFDPKIHELPSIYYSFTNLLIFDKEGAKVVPVISALNLKNIGNNIAYSISIDIEYEEANVELYKRDFSSLTIPPNVEHHFSITSPIFLSELDDSNYVHFVYGRTLRRRKAKIILEFDDIRKNHYSQTAHVAFTICSIDEQEVAVSDSDKHVKKCYFMVHNCFTEPPKFMRKNREVQDA